MFGKDIFLSWNFTLSWWAWSKRCMWLYHIFDHGKMNLKITGYGYNVIAPEAQTWIQYKFVWQKW